MFTVSPNMLGAHLGFAICVMFCDLGPTNAYWSINAWYTVHTAYGGASVSARLPGGQALVAWPTCSRRTAAAFMPSSARGGITTVTCAQAHCTPFPRLSNELACKQ